VERFEFPGMDLGCAIVVIDFEAFTPAGRPPEPVEVAAVALRHGGGVWRLVGQFSRLVRPPEGTPPPVMIPGVSRITPEMLTGAGGVAEVLGELDRRLADPPYRLVAHGAGTEASLIRRQHEHCPHLAATALIDTVAMGRAVVPGLDSYRLDALLARYQIPVPADRHRAMPDVEVTAELFFRLLAEGAAHGCWRDLPALERAAGRARAVRPGTGEQLELEVPAP
jgi:DNA polymerase-3 subunit epsilon